MTLPELLVTMTILATIVGSIAGAFAIGLRVLGPGSAPAQLTGNNDLIAFEQQIGADVNRAVCLAAPGQQTIPYTPPSPSNIKCSPSWVSACATSPTAYQLCIGWYVPGTATCHTVTYSQMAGSGVILRTDSTPSTSTSSRIGTGGLSLVASWSPISTTTNPYSWTSQVRILIAQQGPRIVNPETTTFYLAPLVADPFSPAVPAAVPGTSNPC